MDIQLYVLEYAMNMLDMGGGRILAAEASDHLGIFHTTLL